jgi:cytochrome c peroxidase
MSRFASVLWPGLVVLAAGCGDGNGTTEPPPAPSIDEQLRQRIQGAGVIPVGAMPAQNPAQVELGQALFFDPLLSGNRDIACATCHNPLTHGGDGLSLAIGTGGSGIGASRTLGPGRSFVPRRAPSLLDRGLGLSYLFWDARLQRFGGPSTTGG